MPQFFPEHTPDGLCDFDRGYFDAAEWLANGYGPKYENDSSLRDEDREKLHGWTRKAVKKGKADCKAFREANKADLEEFARLTERGEDLAGYCFWLSRNGHGAGFFDRDAGEVGDRLQDAARVWSGVECESYRNRLMFVGN